MIMNDIINTKTDWYNSLKFRIYKNIKRDFYGPDGHGFLIGMKEGDHLDMLDRFEAFLKSMSKERYRLYVLESTFELRIGEGIPSRDDIIRMIGLEAIIFLAATEGGRKNV
jgi:hypothetical protein